MLPSEVYTSKSIALVVEDARKTQVPFLGLNWFPEVKVAGLDLKWVERETKLPVILAPSNFDTLPTLRARGGVDIKQTEMPFFREEMDFNEKDMYEVLRINSLDDPYLKDALRATYNDAKELVASAEVNPEIMRMALLMPTTGDMAFSIAANNVTYSYNYDASGTWKASNYAALSGTSLWSASSTATPLDDLNTAKKALRTKGKAPKYVLMTSTTFNYLVASEQILNLVPDKTYASEAIVKGIIEANTGLRVITYDNGYTNASGNAVTFLPDGYVTLLPEDSLGKTAFGRTPEELGAEADASVDVSVIGTGIAIAVKGEYGAPLKTKTICSEICLPSFEGMNSIYEIKVV